jgi:hypothetical protein
VSSYEIAVIIVWLCIALPVLGFLLAEKCSGRGR